MIETRLFEEPNTRFRFLDAPCLKEREQLPEPSHATGLWSPLSARRLLCHATDRPIFCHLPRFGRSNWRRSNERPKPGPLIAGRIEEE